VDRRPAQALGRGGLLPAALHAAPRAQPLVAHQPPEGGGADAAGRERPAGLAEVERAKADGRWDAAYAPQSTIEVPEDLQRALDASPAAAERFATLTRSLRYSILWRVHDAKRPETRARRIADYVGRLERGESIR